MENTLHEQLQKHISKNTVIACIGTDKCIGDSLGPLVGSILTEKNFKYPVHGTLEKPIHALNIDDRLELIANTHPDAEIIAIDACLGEETDIGSVKIREYGIRPGKGIGKDLPHVGTTSIVGIVDSSDNAEFFFSRSIRLSLIMNMAKQIADALIKATKETDQSIPK